MIKKILRWLILGGTLFFLATALKNNWQEISAIHIDAAGWAIIAIATGVTLLAHTWAGWIWTWILKDLNQSVQSSLFIYVYLKTNIAKYLPGNVWHYYGRIMAAKNANISTSAATLSVLLEPLLMAAAALIIVLLGGFVVTINTSMPVRVVQIIGLVLVLCAIHPRFLNPLIRLLHRLKTKKSDTATSNVNLGMKNYPLQPLLGELGFLGLRSSGFILTLYALSPLNWSQIPVLLGAFSFAWLLGLVVPGAPGGLGVFETTAIALLQNYFPVAVVISATGVYRLISIVAETSGAVLASLDERFFE
ncbi:MAG: flippase-like domain-containing protein [Chlorogloeopsis fritschii C42_A2020_084]|uniref:lysylphosphatidylglycerol synthase domain-containing protein n=1 Tax=Chlorogloeopsis fritschii TaxID=1124 RepID=UPI0019EB0AE2|nr:lysylphosphatidylglycerol synthase domain-containing protein [Chlorogloeopsis fritschii]MBF2006391.1 flippase-like domain-containing protein [Chlorogloeopsis fritschii C42_A2020_084]